MSNETTPEHIETTPREEESVAAQEVGLLPGNVCPLWTIQEAGAFLRKSERWLRDAVRIPDNEAGSVPHHRLGKSYRFDPQEMTAWAQAGFPPVATFRRWQKKSPRTA